MIVRVAVAVEQYPTVSQIWYVNWSMPVNSALDRYVILLEAPPPGICTLAVPSLGGPMISRVGM